MKGLELGAMAGLFALGVLVVRGARSSSPAPSSSSSSGLVLNPEAAAGVDPRLLAALGAWNEHGAFPIRIADDPRLPVGGLRTAEDQAKAVALGLTGAMNLAQTPHGRGGALDLWPASFDPWKGLSLQPQARADFETLGAFMTDCGLVWGRAFTNLVAPDGTRGDWPHFEVPDWRDLPFPPPRGVA